MTNVTVTFWLEGVLLPVISVFGLIGKLDLQYKGISSSLYEELSHANSNLYVSNYVE